MTELQNAYTLIGDWFSEMADTLLAQPLFLIPLAIFCFGAVIGLVHRVIR